MPYLVRPMRLEDVDEVCQVERQCFTTPWPAQAYRREIRDNRLGRYAVLLRVDDPPNGGPAPRPEAPPVGGEVGEDGLRGVRRAVSQLLRPLLPVGSPEALERPPERAGPAGQPPARHSSTHSSTHAPARRLEHIVGFVGMWLVLDEAHITTICVGQEERGRGLGEVLLAHIMEQAVEMGARRVTLEVRVSNHVAQGLYRKYGFTVEGVRRRYYSDDNEDALVMWSESLESAEYRRRLAELREASYQRAGQVSVLDPQATSAQPAREGR